MFSVIFVMMFLVIFAHSDDGMPMSHVASSICARDLNVVHPLIGVFPLFPIGYLRSQFEVMRVDDPIVLLGQWLVATYRQNARWGAAAI